VVSDRIVWMESEAVVGYHKRMGESRKGTVWSGMSQAAAGCRVEEEAQEEHGAINTRFM
jgi:hypothetical protein